MQKLLAARGAKYWAPVHELRTTDEGAYYVSDYYPLTARKLVETNTELSAKPLHAVVGSVVKGLLELRMRHRRSHGNLKPENVLVAGSADDLLNAQVVLCDPAAESEGPAGRAADLFALGDLIHQLVLHRPYGAEAGHTQATGAQLAEAPGRCRRRRSGRSWGGPGRNGVSSATGC